MTESDDKLQDNQRRLGQAIVLTGVVVALAVFNALAFWRNLDDGSAGDWLRAIMIGVLVFEPILFGIWTALASGSIVTRLPLVVPCLLILFAAPGIRKANFADMQRFEFVAIVLVGMAIFAVTMIAFLAVRWYAGLRIEQPAAMPVVGQSRVRFSMKYLLATITVYAVLLGLATQLTFRTEPPPGSFMIFGPDFFIYVFCVGGAIVSGILLPTIAVPLFVLSPKVSKNAVPLAVAFWYVVTVLTVVILLMVDDEPQLVVLLIVPLIQFGAVVTGLLTSLPLRFVGFRLVRNRPEDVRSSVSNPAAPK